MFVIIEGPNLTGKSTLARELSRMFYMPVVNQVSPRHSVYAGCVGFLTGERGPMILDRFHVSEAVYGPMKRGASGFGPREYWLVELLCLLLGTANVYCTGTVDEILARRRAERPGRETFISEAEVPTEVARFEQEVGRSLLHWEEYRIGDDVPSLGKRLMESSNWRNASARRLTPEQMLVLWEVFRP